MAEVKVKIKTDLPIIFAQFWTWNGGSKFSSDLEKAITEEVTGSMSRGASPVRGYGRFQSYKKPEKYPTRTGNYKGFQKRVRPVNLFLSGDLYRSFGSKVERDGFTYGVLNPNGDVDIYAPVHNNGERADIPQRKFLPNESGEQFTVKIMDRIKEMFSKRLNQLLKLSEK